MINNKLPPLPGQQPYQRQKSLKPRSSDLGGVLIGLGLALLVLFVTVFIVAYGPSRSCSSGLVYAIDQGTCNLYGLAHDFSIGGMIVSGLITLWGILKR